MALSSPRLAQDPRLRRAARNNPPLRLWANDHNAVATVQEALVDIGLDMPGSTRPDGSMDGIYGRETYRIVHQFQAANDLQVDGVVGKETLHALDAALQDAGRQRAAPKSFSYHVPGHKVTLEQPKSSVCWATAFTIMKSWKDGTSYTIKEALSHVDRHWVRKFERNEGLGDTRTFFRQAGLRIEPGATLTIEGWGQMLRRYGLTYLSLSMPTGPGQWAGHGVVVEGIWGDGSPFGTQVSFIDPARGSGARLPFATFNGIYGKRGQIEGRGGDPQIAHY